MRKLNRREIALLVVLGIVVIATAGLLGTPSGTAQKQKTLLPAADATLKYKQDAAKYLAMANQQAALQKQAESLTYTKTAQRLVADEVAWLQKIAHESGVHIQELRPLTPLKVPDGQLATVPMEVRFEASFQPQVVRFLYSVEKPDGRMVLDRVDIAPQQTGSGDVAVTAQVAVFTQSLDRVTETERTTQ